MADSPLKAQWAEALGGWLALQPASANENDRKAHGRTLLIRLKRRVKAARRRHRRRSEAWRQRNGPAAFAAGAGPAGEANLT
jgi:hypothetical protein